MTTFQKSRGNLSQVLVSPDDPLPVTASFSGNITATNPSVGPNDTPAPGNSTLIAYKNAGGNQTAVSPSTPLPITGNVTASVTTTEASVGPTGSAVPGNATYVAWNDGGTLRGISAAKPLPVTGDLTGNVTLSTSDIEIGAVELKDGSSNNRAAISAGGALTVDGSAVTQPVSAASLPLPTGASTAALQSTANTSLGNIDASTSGLSRAEDSASANADKGVAVLILQQATPGDNAGTDGDYAFPQMSAGRIWASAKIDTALPAGTNTLGNITTVGTVSSLTNLVNGNLTTVAAVTTITNNVKVVGPTAADAALTVAPVTVGGLAKTSLPTAVGDGNVTNTLHSKYGQLIARLALRENQANQYTTIGNTTETTIITADASNKLDITALTFTTDAPVSITIRDDTAGTIKDKYTLQGNTTGGFVSSALPKLLQAAVNKPWTMQLSATANVTCSATYTKAGA